MNYPTQPHGMDGVSQLGATRVAPPCQADTLPVALPQRAQFSITHAAFTSRFSV